MTDHLTGNTQQRNGKWRVAVELPNQAVLRCPVCVDGRGRGRRFWADDRPPDACPQCGGELEESVTRRQELMPAQYHTRKEANKALRDTLHARERGDYTPPDDLTVSDWMARWQTALGSEELAPGTLAAYKLDASRIVARIGSIPLQKLTRNDVAVLGARLASDTSKRTGRPLSPATRRATLITLQHALEDAVGSGLLAANPATGAKRPKVRRAEMHTWTGTELSTFLRATRSDRLGSLWHLLALTGLRRGEALALKWSDVDFDHGRLAVQRQRVMKGSEVEERPQTKTGKSRPISIDAATVDVLRRQSAQQLDEAAEWDEAWVGDGHIFGHENGEPWNPNRITKLFDMAVRTVDVPRIRLHDLRHTWATLALRAGVHPKVVQERLGHANISITMDTYSHVLPDMQEAAAELVAALVDLSDDGEK
jgi:integrase